MNWSLYVVTDESMSHGKSHFEIAKEAVEGGADIIQLRDKNADAIKLYQEGCKIKNICKGKALFIVNDRFDIALACSADGVHLGQSDLPPEVVRKFVPPGFIIGVSVGSVDEAKRAAENGADYIAVSPVFDTASKSDAGAGHGLETVKEIREAVKNIPLIGIGGLNESNAVSAVSAGLDGVAVISAVVSAENITAAAKKLRKIIEEAKHGC